MTKLRESIIFCFQPTVKIATTDLLRRIKIPHYCGLRQGTKRGIALSKINNVQRSDGKKA